MGDHKASVKIEMEFHGVKDKADMWINYYPNSDYPGLDQRVVDFFNSVYERGMEVYNAGMRKHDAEMREAQEREEYRRLKAKYGDQA